MTDQEIEKLSIAIAERIKDVLVPLCALVKPPPISTGLPLVSAVVKSKRGWPKGKKRK